MYIKGQTKRKQLELRQTELTYTVSDQMSRSSCEFDGEFCWGNSFCYLASDDAQEFLTRVARCLKPDARFVMDTGMWRSRCCRPWHRSAGFGWEIFSCSVKTGTIPSKAGQI